MPTERKIRWTANFFVWSAVVVLVLNAFPIFDRWSRSHAVQPSSIESVASFVGFLAGALLYNDWLYILVLMNGLVLRRYRSRIAAGLFIVLGLWGVGLALFVFWRIGFNTTAVMMILFFSAYLLVAVWIFIALMPSQGNWLSRFGERLGSYVVQLFRRPDKRDIEARVDAYYALIAKAISQLPINEPGARQSVYERARVVLAEHAQKSDLDRERTALETAIRRCEKSAPRITIGNPLHRPTTISLVISMFFPRLWLIDVTCMSLYWVGRLPKF